MIDSPLCQRFQDHINLVKNIQLPHENELIADLQLCIDGGANFYRLVRPSRPIMILSEISVIPVSRMVLPIKLESSVTSISTRVRRIYSARARPSRKWVIDGRNMTEAIRLPPILKGDTTWVAPARLSFFSDS